MYICVLPFFHIYGMVAVMLTALEHGAKLVTLPRFESESYLNAVYNNHVISRLFLFYVIASKNLNFNLFLADFAAFGSPIG